MSVLTRVERNVVRGRARTIGVAFAVGVAISAFLILSQINTGVSADVAAAQAAVADVVTVQPAGASSFNLGQHLNGSIVPTVRAAPHVVSVQRILLVTPGFTPGNGSGGAGSFRGGGGGANFTLYEGIDTTSPITSFGGFAGASTLSVSAGRMLNGSDEDKDVAIVGSAYAANHGVAPGSEISINGTGVEVVGVFSTGTTFGNRNVIVPYPVAVVAFGASGPNLLYLDVDTPDDVAPVVAYLQSTLGSNYDVSAPSENTNNPFTSDIDSILSSTQFESEAALAIGAAIMVLVMAIVTTQRTREIGILKAFGFSNGKILAQLVTEGVVLSALGLPIALVATVWLGPTVAQSIAGSAAGGTGGRFFGGGGFASRLIGSVSFSLTPEILLVAVVVTFAFGLIGSLYPIVRALRLRPAEALRRE
jgi:ABC-type antimicrobial peptide transport system permease subunit